MFTTLNTNQRMCFSADRFTNLFLKLQQLPKVTDNVLFYVQMNITLITKS